MSWNNNKSMVNTVGLFLAIVFIAAPAFSKRSYLTSVNSTCNTTYSCNLCHVNANGGGARNAEGQAFQAGGYDAGYFCPTRISNLPPIPRHSNGALKIENDQLIFTTDKPRMVSVSISTLSGKVAARFIVSTPAAGTYALQLRPAVSGRGLLILHTNIAATPNSILLMMKQRR